MNETQPVFERRKVDDIKDRLARAEQAHSDLKERFQEHKQETQAEFKTLAEKLDVFAARFNAFQGDIASEINSIKITIAKWLGAGTVIVALIEIAFQYFIKHNG